MQSQRLLALKLYLLVALVGGLEVAAELSTGAGNEDAHRYPAPRSGSARRRIDLLRGHHRS